jgi:hypothetical protein
LSKTADPIVLCLPPAMLSLFGLTALSPKKGGAVIAAGASE